MSQILANAQYLTQTVLHPMFHDRRVHFPTMEEPGGGRDKYGPYRGQMI